MSAWSVRGWEIVSTMSKGWKGPGDSYVELATLAYQPSSFDGISTTL